MTERCQNKFTENLENRKYIIYFGVISASITVLYFYRFHFVTITFSYVLGCLACYCGLNSTILHNYLDNLKCHFITNPPEDEQEEVPLKGCAACGSKTCARHDAGLTSEPWEGLQIHKQLDQAIQDFYNAILDQFVNTWYSKITLQPFFVDELRHQLRYASACLLRRALKVNYSHLILNRLVGCALQHYTVWSEGGPGTEAVAPHPAACSREAELRYLRSLTNALMPYLLDDTNAHNSVFRVLIREIFAGWVLLSLTDVLADPYILNNIIILATSNEKMAALPTTPNYKVEFLETFVRHNETVYSKRGKLLRLDLEFVINDQDYLYAFMQYMKTTCHMHLLQFYKDIKVFQCRVLNPELDAAEQAQLVRAARDLLHHHLAEGPRLPLPDALQHELAHLLDSLHQDDAIKRLQTSRALYQAARQSHTILEKIILPKFLHSEEFYKLVVGSRAPTGYQKQHIKKPIGKPTNFVRPERVSGHNLDTSTNSDVSDADGLDKMDILKYLETVAAEEKLREHDLRTYKVVLTNVKEQLQFPPRRGTVRVFTLAVHRVEDGSAANLWTVERSEHDFHLLRSKLHEFHGDKLFLDLQLPSRRDNSPLETLRYKYEDFLQRLLQKSLLQTSELLYFFLIADGDFSMALQPSTLNANSTDLANLYQSVTYKLRKEKGQHLEGFLRNLLFSSDLERYQVLKQGNASSVEEAVEVSEAPPAPPSPPAPPGRPRRGRRGPVGAVFGDNFGLQLPRGASLGPWRPPHALHGFTDCCIYFLVRVVECGEVVRRVVCGLLQRARPLPDRAAAALVRRALPRLLPPPRLARLVTLAHELIFGSKDRERTSSATRDRAFQRARDRLTALLGGRAAAALQLLQRPHLNKQLVYNLLDLCVIELFPELGATRDMPSKEPKS
ncbi:sorting nexin-14-like [Achroia grisella]|uniref:sorting nexin-14-like n=1 Tax=Achroia grisella TaxID=688607 RepID=UPI0027D23047|nr:sorting nexin-14-like [Achroia grisella]